METDRGKEENWVRGEKGRGREGGRGGGREEKGEREKATRC